MLYIGIDLGTSSVKLLLMDAAGNVKNIVFDFKDVSFMDSSGIGLIMGRYKKVMFIGGKAAVTNVGNAVDRIFKISGLYKIIEKYDTIQEALYENRI